ncbi:hypothetical protein EVAR_431_1 [Eumeta japonica]|uniref:Uncharacterized protein n=1 Tax=Eumeta variegata TaxID=151549 RepID=A0A4C1SAE3_EUMVA|nr:hypothetical protein EVAR_431_1 [Eumeta japonica]
MRAPDMQRRGRPGPPGASAHRKILAVSGPPAARTRMIARVRAPTCMVRRRAQNKAAVQIENISRIKYWKFDLAANSHSFHNDKCSDEISRTSCAVNNVKVPPRGVKEPLDVCFGKDDQWNV